MFDETAEGRRKRNQTGAAEQNLPTERRYFKFLKLNQSELCNFTVINM